MEKANEKEINEKEEDIIEDLDISWLRNFDKIDNEYKMFYSEEISFINIHSIYLDNNEIIKLKEEKIILKTFGILQKEELLSLIKYNSFLNKIKYSLLSILKFDVNLEPAHLKTFLNNKSSNGQEYLQLITNLDNIKFGKSISIFHDINEILLIFYKPIISSIKNRKYTKKNIITIKPKKQTKKIT
jgi:uncharacterized protein involved in tolerance to divalent cations